MNIFSLGSVLYTIITGHWPFREDTRPFTVEGMLNYGIIADGYFEEGSFPDTVGLFGKEIIRGCWTQTSSNSQDINVSALKLDIPVPGNVCSDEATA